MADQGNDFFNEPFRVMEEEAKKTPEQKNKEQVAAYEESGEISPEQSQRWLNEASLQRGMSKEFVFEYLFGRPDLKEEDVNRLQEFLDNDTYMREGIDATSPHATFSGVVNEIIYGDEDYLLFTYLPHGKELPLGVIRNSHDPDFVKIAENLDLGSEVEVKLDEKGEIDSVDILENQKK